MPDSVNAPWFGLFLPQLRMSFATILERTLAAEAAGFDSVWLMDHLAAPAATDQDTLEGWTLAAALAARTTTIRRAMRACAGRGGTMTSGGIRGLDRAGRDRPTES